MKWPVGDYKIDCTFEQLVGFVKDVCCEEAQRIAIESLSKTPGIIGSDDYFKSAGHADGGPKNNGPWMMAWYLAASLFHDHGRNHFIYEKYARDDWWERCMRNAVKWLRHYRRVQSDVGHTYLDGPKALEKFAAENGLPEIEDIACDVINRDVAHAKQKLKDYAALRRLYSNTRLVTRAAASVALKEPPQFLWYLTQPFEIPEVGEAVGWGSDTMGTPFHLGLIGDDPAHWYHKHGKTGFVVPWMELSIQPYALMLVYRRQRNDPWNRPTIRMRLEDLNEWFWRSGYQDTDDPYLRGIGETKALPAFDPVTGQLQRHGSHAFYPMWLFLRGKSVRDVGRMVDGMILQTKLKWPEFLWLQFFRPEFLEMVTRYMRDEYRVD
jgi:hypothetical protein